MKITDEHVDKVVVRIPFNLLQKSGVEGGSVGKVLCVPEDPSSRLLAPRLKSQAGMDVPVTWPSGGRDRIQEQGS